ncbi:MAG: MBL fold metallo-hydrolase [Negativicutes bacterium]|jgi:L-ascorbate metabolism protein UlaG (beta-lactamase superfamily)|nr:MBL fold metallo-hydrolase [Negativicutes bacterium]
MTSPKAKITYLFHSGYAVETQQHLFIFDYYQPGASRRGGLTDGIITADYLKEKANVFVFVSHSHQDHFDPVIFEWAKTNPAITYVLSSDIRSQVKVPHYHIMSPYQKWKQEAIEVQTFGSTDEGLSFLVRADGLSIFHAGDLNWWHWKGETKAERDYADSIFKAEMEKIGSEAIDIAFFPVDRRLEEFYCIGAEYFAAQTQPKLLLPMHFGDDFGASKAFAEKVKNTPLTTVEITRRGQEILF